MKLKDQVAIVTGAGRNIGEEIAKLLAQNGAKVAVVDMDPGRGSKVAGEIVGHGGEAAAFVADISSEADVARLIKDISARWGRVDILVNNAAISDNKDILEITKVIWE
jgi:3-oxoacyl-[acyl-carrier protein] reductase